VSKVNLISLHFHYTILALSVLILLSALYLQKRNADDSTSKQKEGNVDAEQGEVKEDGVWAVLF